MQSVAMLSYQSSYTATSDEVSVFYTHCPKLYRKFLHSTAHCTETRDVCIDCAMQDIVTDSLIPCDSSFISDKAHPLM